MAKALSEVNHDENEIKRNPNPDAKKEDRNTGQKVLLNISLWVAEKD